ncbi:hypothetical protein DEO72_LG7g1028 [Vigna unguiculata]|uniref:Uncharacterized protein n=1 Tax=Vigna unguiculata TaxID=3917 RepID=A0A4D6MG21_VIGUN|nr:hypothetical protein DEO72_LG7g1028 [Vigna unguiculata]
MPVQFVLVVGPLGSIWSLGPSDRLAYQVHPACLGRQARSARIGRQTHLGRRARLGHWTRLNRRTHHGLQVRLGRRACFGRQVHLGCLARLGLQACPTHLGHRTRSNLLDFQGPFYTSSSSCHSADPGFWPYLTRLGHRTRSIHLGCEAHLGLQVRPVCPDCQARPSRLGRRLRPTRLSRQARLGH